LAIAAIGCRTPAQVYDEQQSKPQRIEQAEGVQVVQPGDLAIKPPSTYAGKTIQTTSVITGIFNPQAITIDSGVPTKQLLVLFPKQVALPPGATSTNPWLIRQRVQVTGQVQVYAVAQLAPGVYALVPPSSQAQYANRPVLLATDVVYLDQPYTAVAVTPSGVQVAKGAPLTTGPITRTPTPSKVATYRGPALREVATLVKSPNPASYAGAKVLFTGVPVIEVPSDKTFWVEAGTGRVLCVIDEVNKGGTPEERALHIHKGDRVTIAGTVRNSASVSTRDPLTAQDKKSVASVPVYVWVDTLRK
jgi:hypothetical protein